LGSRFNDPQLNARVRDKNDFSAEPFNVFACAEELGVFVFSCAVCKIQVSGKKNIDSHIEGKRHKTKMAEFAPAGTVIIYFS
jgi:hypothetical protein